MARFFCSAAGLHKGMLFESRPPRQSWILKVSKIFWVLGLLK